MTYQLTKLFRRLSKQNYRSDT